MPASKPLTVASTKLVFQIIPALLAGYFAYNVFFYSELFAARGLLDPTPSALRLTVLSLRDPSLSPALANPLRFSALLDGCPVPAASLSVLRPPTSGENETTSVFELRLPGPSRVNGYLIKIDEGPAAADPVRWRVEAAHRDGNGTADDGGSWRVVGASVWRGTGSTAIYYPALSYPTPSAHPTRIAVDYRPTWPWFLLYVLDYLTAAVAWFVIAVVGRLGRPQITPRVWQTMFLFNSVMEAASAVGCSLLGDWRGAADAALYSVPNALLGLSLLKSEAWAAAGLAVYGVAGVSAETVRDLVIYDEEANLFGHIVLLSTFYAGLFALSVVTVRFLALRRARGLVLGDRAKYDAIWAGVLADASESEHIGALTAAVVLVRDATPGVARHVNRWWGAEEGALGCGEAGTLDEAVPVTSQDQIYFQVRQTAVHQLRSLFPFHSCDSICWFRFTSFAKTEGRGGG